MTKNEVEKMNIAIKDAILVSQLEDHPGFLVLSEWLTEMEKNFRYQDILGLKDNDTVRTQQGMVLAFNEVIQFFKDKKVLALKPMVDPDTMEREVLNNNKN